MGLEFESPAGHQKSSEINRFPSFFFYFRRKNRRFETAFFRVSNPLVTPTGHQKAAERLLFCVPDGDSKTCNATIRWTVARATDAELLASKAFGNLPDCKQPCAPERDSNIFAAQKCKRTQAGHQKAAERLLFCVPDGDSKTCNFLVTCDFLKKLLDFSVPLGVYYE